MLEVRDNYNMFCRWTTQAILTGCKLMLFAFVQRKKDKKGMTHQIVKVLQVSTENFADQIGLDLSNGWSMLEEIIKVVKSKPEASYLFSKDKNCNYSLKKLDSCLHTSKKCLCGGMGATQLKTGLKKGSFLSYGKSY